MDVLNTNSLALLQAAHDIRSPLSALNMLIQTLPEVSEDKSQLLKLIVARINEIAEDLLEVQPSGERFLALNIETQNDPQASPGEIISDLIKEKRLEYPGVEFVASQSCFKIKGLMPKRQVSRVLSNLINNSVEAKSTRVVISASRSEHSFFVTVSDNGRGFGHTQQSSTTKKMNRPGDIKPSHGHGLGLRHAQGLMKRLGGHVKFWSRRNIGTVVSLGFPKNPKHMPVGA